MTNWKEYKLGEIGEVITGKTPSKKNPEQWGDIMPFVTPTDFDAYNKNIVGSIRYLSAEGINAFQKKVLPQDSVIVTCIGSQMGKVALNKKECVTNQQINSIIPHKEFNSDFIYYVISSMQDYLRNLATGGSTMPIVNKSTFEEITIKAPDLPTQTAIAEILSSLDDKIELNNKINQELENLAQTLFKQWFIDFEFPNENGEPYRSSGGEMVDSELGEIPKGWKVGIISDFFEILSGFPFKSENFDDSGEYKIATIKNVQDGKFITKTDNCINELPLKMPKYIILNQGDVLLSLTGNVGRTCFVQANNFLLNQRVAKIQLKGSSSTAFPYYFFRRSEFQQLLISIAKGTAQLNLSPIEIKTLKIAFPSCFDLISLDIFDSFFQQQLENEVESFSLSELRDTLLPKLISGELVVSDIQTKTL